MIFHENRLLADDSCNIIPYFCRKLGKMSQNLSSAAVMIGTLRVKYISQSLVPKADTLNLIRTMEFSTQFEATIFGWSHLYFEGSQTKF